MKQHLSRNEIVDLMRTVADNLAAVDEGNFFAVWMKILNVMETHNPELRKDTIGKSMIQLVLGELERLYALDKTAKAAFNPK